MASNNEQNVEDRLDNLSVENRTIDGESLSTDETNTGKRKRTAYTLELKSI